MDHLGLVQPVDCLGQGVVVAISFAAHRRLDTRLGQPLAVANADVLGPPVDSRDKLSQIPIEY